MRISGVLQAQERRRDAHRLLGAEDGDADRDDEQPE
jgi:hypothetical protein